MNLDDQVIQMYDTHVATKPDGVKVAEAKDAIRQDVRSLLAAQKRDLDSEVEAVLSRVIMAERNKRSQNLRQSFEYLLDGFSEDGAYVDPILSRAYRLGDQSGTDRLLRFWSVENIRDTVLGRYRIGSEAVAAAASFDTAATAVIRRMQLVGAISLGSVWTSPATE